jgi:beta-galactosidase
LDVAGLIYTARTDNENGQVKEYELYASLDGKDWGDAISRGRFRRSNPEETIRLSSPVRARFLKFVMLSEQRGQPFASVAELEVVEAGREKVK